MKLRATTTIPLNSGYVTGVTFLHNGGLVVCDRYKRSLRLYDFQFRPQGELTLDDVWDAASVSQSEIAVTVPHLKIIQFVTIDLRSKLKIGRKLNVGRHCFGIDVVCGRIFVTCHENGLGEGHVLILSMDGEILSRPGRNGNTYLMTSPNYVIVGKNRNHLFVTDSESNVITCMDLQGEVISQWKIEGLDRTNGISLIDLKDSSSIFIICGRGSNKVINVDSNGRKLGELLGEKDAVTGPMCVSHRNQDGACVFGMVGNRKQGAVKIVWFEDGS